MVLESYSTMRDIPIFLEANTFVQFPIGNMNRKEKANAMNEAHF